MFGIYMPELYALDIHYLEYMTALPVAVKEDIRTLRQLGSIIINPDDSLPCISRTIAPACINIYLVAVTNKRFRLIRKNIHVMRRGCIGGCVVQCVLQTVKGPAHFNIAGRTC